MMILSKIYLEIEEGENSYGNAIDMFLRENFEVFCKAIDAVTLKDDNILKPGLRQNVFHFTKKSVKIL